MLNPLLLLFLPLALVPVVLHLITLRRLRSVELSTFRFLMDSYVQQRRRIKALEYLVMVLRALFIALLIILLSRPIIESMPWLTPGSSGRQVTIMIDSGLTMGRRWGGTTNLQRAQSTANAIINLLGPNDKVNIIEAGPVPQLLLSRFAGKPETLIAAIEQLKPGTAHSQIATALEEALDSESGSKQLFYIISDFNRQSWQAVADHPALRQIDPQSQIVLLDVSPEDPAHNAAVVGEPPEATNIVAGLPLVLNATVVNGSPEHGLDTVLSVILDDEQVNQLNVSLQPNQRITKAITVTPNRPGPIKGRFELSGDEFTEDDTYLFALNVQPRLAVLIVSPTVGNKDIDTSDELYLRAALTASTATADEDADKAATSFDVSSIRPEQINAALLNKSDVVILADVPMDAKKGKLLKRYVEDGGGLLILPGRHVAAEMYSAHLLRVAGPTSGGQSVAALGLPQGDPDDEMQFVPISAVELSHPVFSAFADPQEAYFATTRIYRRFPITLTEADIDPAPRVLVRVRPKAPALVELTMGSGRVLLAGFPASPKWTNLVQKPAFLPFLLRSVTYLRRTQPVGTLPAVKPYQPAVLNVASSWSDAQVEVTDPAGKRWPLELNPSGSEEILTAAMVNTSGKGFYDVQVTPAKDAKRQPASLGFAVNLDTTEAAFDSMPQEQLAELFQPIVPTHIKGTADDPVLVSQLQQKREIWRMLIWFAFAVIGLEFLLSTLGPSKTRSKKAGKHTTVHNGGSGPTSTRVKPTAQRQTVRS